MVNQVSPAFNFFKSSISFLLRIIIPKNNQNQKMLFHVFPPVNQSTFDKSSLLSCMSGHSIQIHHGFQFVMCNKFPIATIQFCFIYSSRAGILSRQNFDQLQSLKNLKLKNHKTSTRGFRGSKSMRCSVD